MISICDYDESMLYKFDIKLKLNFFNKDKRYNII